VKSTIPENAPMPAGLREVATESLEETGDAPNGGDAVDANLSVEETADAGAEG
jgi:hypothetical protein